MRITIESTIPDTSKYPSPMRKAILEVDTDDIKADDLVDMLSDLMVAYGYGKYQIEIIE